MQFTPKSNRLLFIPILLSLSLQIAAQITTPELSTYTGPSSQSTWSGFYAGLNAGYAFPNNQQVNVNSSVVQYCTPLQGCTDNPAAANAAAAGSNGAFSLFNDGFIGGGQLGYHRKIYDKFVTGLEADIQGIAGALRSGPKIINVNNSNVGNNPVSVESDLITSKNINYLGTLRGKLGFLVKPSILLSASGGLAYGGVSSQTVIGQGYLLNPGAIVNNWGTIGNYNNTRVGWTAGGDLEWQFLSNWSATIEYLYYNLGTVTYSSNNLIATKTNTPGNYFSNSVSTTTQFNGQLVRVGANYHFN